MKLKKIIQKITPILILFIMAFFICMKSPLNFFLRNSSSGVDSSVFKYIAFGMSKGLVPYRDMFDHKGIILYIINYIGLNLAYYRGIWVIEFLFMYLSLLFSYLIARKFTNKFSSVIVSTLSFGLIYEFFEGGNLTEEYAIFFLMVSSYIFIDYFCNKSNYSSLETNLKREKIKINYRYFNILVYVCGMCFGIVFFLRANMISLWVVMCSLVFVDCILSKNYKELLKFIISFGLGIMTITIPILLYLLINNALNDFIQDYFIFNFLYSNANFEDKVDSLRYFGNNPLIFLAFVILIYSIKLDKKKRMFNIGYIIYMIINILLVSMSGRIFNHYGMIFIPMLVYPFCLLFQFFDLNKSFNNYLNYIITGYLFISFIFPTWLNFLCDGTKTIGISLKNEDNILESSTVQYIINNTDNEDYITVFGNFDIIYLSTKRLSASKYSYIRPIGGINKKIVEEYFDDLEKNVPKVIVFEKNADNMTYAYDKMMNFIKSHNYVEVNELDYETFFLKENSE